MGESSRSTGQGTRTPSASGATGDDTCEEKTVTLTIKNVAKFLAMSNEEMEKNDLSFEAGLCTLKDGTTTRATWKYFFDHTVDLTGADNENWIGGFLTLTLKEPRGRGKALKSARAWHSVSLSSGGTIIASYDSGECKEFIGARGSGRQTFITESELLEKTKETNSFEVTLLVKVFCNQGFIKPVAVLENSSPPLEAEVTEMRGEVNSDFKKLLESGIGTDVEIVVYRTGKLVLGEACTYTKQAHKTVLMARSPVFAKMFAKDSKAETVYITKLSQKGLDIFLHFLYTGEVLADWVQVFEELINVAEKYQCGKLKQFCSHNLKSAVTTANALDLLKFAKKHKLSFAEKKIMEFIHKNSKSVFTEAVIDKVIDVSHTDESDAE